MGARDGHGDGLTTAQRRALLHPPQPRPPKVGPGEWRPEWVRKRDRANPPPITPQDVEHYAASKRRSLQLKAEADALLRAEGIVSSKTVPTRGAPWLAHVTDEPVRAAIYRTLCEYDSTLCPLGHRALSSAWREVLRRWLVESGKLTLTLRKGRRIGASTIIAPRLIAAWVEVVAPRICLPPGEIVVVGLVSVRRGEATNRIAQISSVLAARKLPHNVKYDRIELIGAPVEIRVITRNWKTAVGENIGLLWCDEVSRWESDDSSANPANEVIGSLRPALATLQLQGLALMTLVSSPWSDDDYHAQQYDRGETTDQCTAFLPTWIGRDDITELQTRWLEPDERIWRREYAAMPGNVLSQALDTDDVIAAFGMVVPAGDLRRWCCIDASSLRGDAFAWMVGHEARGGLVVDQMGGFSDQSMRDLTLDTVVEEVSMACRARGITRVWGDQREEAGLYALFLQRKIAFESFAWTNPSKHEAFTYLRRFLRDRRLQLPEHPQLRTQMRTCKARLMSSGVVVYETNGLDYLSTLVTLMHAYEAHFPLQLSQILSGRVLDASPNPEEVGRRRAEEQRLRFRREAEKRAKTTSIRRIVG